MREKDITRHKCCGCKACEQVCPKQCISMKTDREGFWYPFIDKKACIDCNQCIKVCPLNFQSLHEPASECYAFVGDKEKLMSSSSGGAFETICRSYLSDKDKYAIYGAGFIQNQVRHVRITSLSQLDKLKRSKYVQSDTESIYQMVKQDLGNSYDVIFSGTPCQIQALRNYLKSNEKKLLTIDIVCHGVPSPLMFQKYCEFLSSNNNTGVESFVFRHKKKTNGIWDTQGTKIVFSNSHIIEKETFRDEFMVAFSHELMTRLSCHECPFMTISRSSDITLGDFWGLVDYSKELSISHTGGCSLIIPNSEKGRYVIDNFSYNNDELFQPFDIKKAIERNTPLSRPSKTHRNRSKFIQKIKKNPNCFARYLDICLSNRKSLIYRLKNRLKLG